MTAALCECKDAAHSVLHMKGCKRSPMYLVELHPSLERKFFLCGACTRFVVKNRGSKVLEALYSKKKKKENGKAKTD